MYDLSNMPEHVPPPAKAWKKDAEAFAQGKGSCYWAGGVNYTRTDFVQVANGEVAVAEQLFSLISELIPQKALYQLVNEGVLRVPDYMSDRERTVLSFQGPPLPTAAHQHLLQEQGWEAIFPELAYPRLWAQQVPDVPVPQGIAFTDLLKRSEPEAEEGNDHD